jgi:hypothetical protein
MKSFFVLVLAVALGVVGGALWGIVADGCAAAAEPPKRSGLVERMKANRAERRKPVQKGMAKLRQRVAERRDRRRAQGAPPAPVVVTPSQSGPSSRAPKAPTMTMCPACRLLGERTDLAGQHLQ